MQATDHVERSKSGSGLSLIAAQMNALVLACTYIFFLWADDGVGELERAVVVLLTLSVGVDMLDDFFSLVLCYPGKYELFCSFGSFFLRLDRY